MSCYACVRVHAHTCTRVVLDGISEGRLLVSLLPNSLPFLPTLVSSLEKDKRQLDSMLSLFIYLNKTQREQRIQHLSSVQTFF